MAFKSADRFGFTITLPFSETRKYLIQSPPVEVGNFMVESTQLAGQRVGLALELSTLLEQQENLSEDASPEERDELDAKIEETKEVLAAMTERLTVPDGMEDSYFESVLGDAYGKMVENGEPFELVKLAASTVAVWVLSGREDAEEFWNNGGRHRRPQKAPQDRKAKRGRHRNPGTSK